jgi:hypothetical protein
MAAQLSVIVYGGIRTVIVSTKMTVPSMPAATTLNWPSPVVSQQMQCTSLASPLVPASKYFPNPNPVFALTEISGAVMDTADALITTATRLQSAPTDIYFVTNNTKVLVARCNGSQWACWSSEKKRDVVVGSVCAALLLVFIIVCCCPVTRRRGNGISDLESGLENNESGDSPAPNIARQQSKNHQGRSWLRSRMEYPPKPRVKQSHMVPLSDIRTSSLSSTLPRDTKLTNDHSDFQLRRRGLAAGCMHQAWQGSPRLLREPSARVTMSRPTPGSSYDPLMTSGVVRGVPRGDTSRMTRQNRGHLLELNDKNYSLKRGFFIVGPQKYMARAQMGHIPSPLRRELASSDISSSLGSTPSSRDSISSLERR